MRELELEYVDFKQIERKDAVERYVWIQAEMAINPQLKLKDFEVI